MSIAGDGTLPEGPEDPTREWLESNRAPLPSRAPVEVEESEDDDQATVSGPPQARVLKELGENVDGFPQSS